MATHEDEGAARDAIKAHVEDDEHVPFDIERVAELEWDENPAPGRPEMTGQWRLHYRDGSSDEIDLPRANVDGAIKIARDLVAKKLTGR